jgi:hypothetical protein
MTVLSPGMYFVEMAFEREVDLPTLSRALGQMGFSDVVFDQSLSEPMTGASLVSRKAMGPASPARKLSSQVTQAKVTQKAPIAAKVAPQIQRTMAPAARTAPSAPVKRAPEVLRAPVVQKAPLLTKLPTTLPTTEKAPLRAMPFQKPPRAATSAVAMPAEGMPAEGMPAEGMPAEGMPPGGGGGGGGFESEAEGPAEEVQADAEAEPVQMPSGVARQARIRELWQRWVEWGSPFATGPRTSGEREPLLRVRFFGNLLHPITTQDRPGMVWLLTHRMRTNPLADLQLQGRPWELREGRTYEFRFLAREKTAPTRDAVKSGLVAMGFAPMKLLAVKKNMRLPRRPTSLALWYGVGQWARPNSVVTRDDPFFFEEVREVR